MFRLATPSAGGGAASGALAIIHLWADDAAVINRWSEWLSGGPLAPGDGRLARLLGVDDGMVLRAGPLVLCITPHGSPLVIDRLSDELRRRGARMSGADDVCPEHEHPVDVCLARALSRTPSPRAFEVLTRQAAWWRAALSGRESRAMCDEATARALARLMDPPVVAAVGRPNVGKSTLTNALARRRVSITANEPGTTRDHVGVTLLLDGLCVRWLDTPGVGAGASAEETIDIVRRAVMGCDAVVWCDDGADDSALPDLLAPASAVPVVRCMTRADRRPVVSTAIHPAWIPTAALRGEGLAELALAVRRAMVADTALAETRLWRFDRRLPEVRG